MYKHKSSDPRQKQFFFFDNELILPEYIVYFHYTPSGLKPSSPPTINNNKATTAKNTNTNSTLNTTNNNSNANTNINNYETSGSSFYHNVVDWEKRELQSLIEEFNQECDQVFTVIVMHRSIDTYF